MNNIIIIGAILFSLIGLTLLFTSAGKKEQTRQKAAAKPKNLDEEFLEAIKNDNSVKTALLLKKVPVDTTDQKNWTALLYAAKSGNEKIVGLLLSSNADVDHQSFSGKTALFYALEEGRLNVARQLLKANANVNIATEKGETPLYTAIANGNYDSVELLLEYEAKVRVSNTNGITPLMFASIFGDEDIVELILEEGETISPEDACLETEEIEGIEEEVKQGTNILVNARASNGWTPLMFAIEKGNYGAFKMLLSRGADPFSISKSAFTTLMIAICGKDTRIIEELIVRGVNINAQLEDGSTAMHLAVVERNEDAIKILLEHKADHRIKNLEGENPQSFALSRRANSMASLIEEIIENRSKPKN